MRSAHGFYIDTIYSLVRIHVYLPPPLGNLVGKRRGYYPPYAQPNPPHICQTSLPVYYSSSEFPPDNFYKRTRKFMNRNQVLRVVVMEEIAMVPKLLNISSTSGTKILSLFSPYASLLMPTMWNFNR